MSLLLGHTRYMCNINIAVHFKLDEQNYLIVCSRRVLFVLSLDNGGDVTQGGPQVPDQVRRVLAAPPHAAQLLNIVGGFLTMPLRIFCNVFILYFKKVEANFIL